jgi:hypothetical protein
MRVYSSSVVKGFEPSGIIRMLSPTSPPNPGNSISTAPQRSTSPESSLSPARDAPLLGTSRRKTEFGHSGMAGILRSGENRACSHYPFPPSAAEREGRKRFRCVPPLCHYRHRMAVGGAWQ